MSGSASASACPIWAAFSVFSFQFSARAKMSLLLASPDEAAPTPRNQATEVPLRNKKV
jgi:hypothetical protein